MDGRTRIECRFEDETIWLTQALIAELFQVSVPTVNEHLKGIFAEGELAAEATIRKFRMVRTDVLVHLQERSRATPPCGARQRRARSCSKAYALPPVTREERAARAKLDITRHFNDKQQAFLEFVLGHYVDVGVEELDPDKLTPLLRLRHHNSIADAVADLGKPDEINRVFAGFQKYLYQRRTAA